MNVILTDDLLEVVVSVSVS